MDKQEFRQLSDQQQLDYLKQLVEDKYKGHEVALSFSFHKHIAVNNETAISLSWEEPSGIYDEYDYAYYQENFEGLCTSVLFNVMAYVDAEQQPVLCIHYFLYY